MGFIFYLDVIVEHRHCIVSTEDYARAAPPHSYIHVDEFPSAKELADYLHKLDQNDDLYNEYFQWV